MTEEQHRQRRVVRTTSLIALGVVLLLAACWAWRSSRPSRQGEPSSQGPAVSNESRSLAAPAPSSTPPSFEQTLAALRSRGGNPSPGSTGSTLLELRSALRQLPVEEASRRIREFLTTTNDAPTGASFKVGSDGFLSGAPTLRTFLMDQLGQLDPAGAAAQARTVLETMNSPDEWALALRSLARTDSSEEGRSYLAGKLRAMLTHERWVRDPSVGFLEAFDVAVYLRDPGLVPTLTDLVRLKDNQGAAHAAYLALDRLTLADPAGTLAALQANPENMQGREVTRANYFARADVRDEAQRRVLESYLLQPNLGAEELAKFAGLYPSANFMVSHNLLTKNQTPDGAWLAARDREALNQLQVWMKDERFARLQPQLRQIEQRLREFVRQASATP